MLIEELRRIEIRKKERERKAQDLQKFIAAGERHTPSTPMGAYVFELQRGVCLKLISRQSFQ